MMLVAAYVSYAVHPFKPPTIYLKDVAALTHTIASPKAPQKLPDKRQTPRDTIHLHATPVSRKRQYIDV